jgi:hypothetical protein
VVSVASRSAYRMAANQHVAEALALLQKKSAKKSAAKK